MALVPVTAAENTGGGFILNVSMAVLLPLLRPALVRLGLLACVLCVLWGALYVAQRWFKPSWETAQFDLQTAQSLLNEAKSDQNDLDTHRRTYESLKASGLLGGDPRAVWVEDLQRVAADMGLSERVSFTLSSPQAIELPLADAVGARVSRHVLEYTLDRVHDEEALRFVDRFVGSHEGVARLMGCTFEHPTLEGLLVRCHVNFLHIEPPKGAADNGSR